MNNRDLEEENSFLNWDSVLRKAPNTRFNLEFDLFLAPDCCFKYPLHSRYISLIHRSSRSVETIY